MGGESGTAGAPAERRRRELLAAALVLTVATGFSGLVYEVTWQKYLAILLGSHSEATAAVLGIFLAGLAAGYEIFGTRTQRLLAAGRSAHLLVLYAAVEGGIGLWALAFPWLFAAARGLSLALPIGVEPLAFGVDVSLTALLIGPPTILMGGTIPILTQALARDLRDATRVHAWVYGFNTMGAFAGALAAGFVLIPRLGLDATLAAMSLVNLSAAVCFALLGRFVQVPAGGVDAAGSAAPRPAVGLAGYAAVACLTGFAMMAIQTVVIRIGGLSFGASHFTFSMVVAVFVLCIALGSLVVSLLPRVPGLALLVNQWALVLVIGVYYGFLDQAPYWVHVLRTRFGSEPGDFMAFQRAAFGWLLLALGPAVLLSGAALPLLFHHARQRAGELGAVAGRLYAWNTVGSLFGALLGGYALLFFLDLDAVYRVALGALVASAALLVVILYGRTARLAAGVLAVGGCAGLLLLRPWDPGLLTAGFFRYREPLEATGEGPQALLASVRKGAKLVFHEDDPTTTVSIIECCPGTSILERSLFTNGKPDSNTRLDYVTTALVGLLPALFAEQTERAFVIGWGTGVSASVLAGLDDMKEVVVAEISPGVLDAAPLFDFSNDGASHNSRIHVLTSDAYRALQRTPGTFDVIASEPSNPWVSGVEMLYSVEFLRAVRERLAPGGVYAQWYHQYESDDASMGLVLRSFAAVFDHLVVWYGIGPDLILLGLNAPENARDLDRLLERMQRPDFARPLARCGLSEPARFLAHELWPLGTLHALDLKGPLHTLTHPHLADRAARAFFAGGAGELPFVGEEATAKAEEPLVTRYLARTPASERPAVLGAIAEESCRQRQVPCVLWLASWELEKPYSVQPQALLHSAKPLVGGPPRPKLVEVAKALLSPEPLAEDERLSPTELQRRTAMFARYYRPVRPFVGERLLEMWKRCEAPGNPAACEAGQRQAEALLDGNAAAFVR